MTENDGDDMPVWSFVTAPWNKHVLVKWFYSPTPLLKRLSEMSLCQVLGTMAFHDLIYTVRCKSNAGSFCVSGSRLLSAGDLMWISIFPSIILRRPCASFIHFNICSCSLSFSCPLSPVKCCMIPTLCLLLPPSLLLPFAIRILLAHNIFLPHCSGRRMHHPSDCVCYLMMLPLLWVFVVLQ